MDEGVFEQPLTAESLQQILAFLKKNGLTVGFYFSLKKIYL